jgi:hypothetical protein
MVFVLRDAFCVVRPFGKGWKTAQNSHQTNGLPHRRPKRTGSRAIVEGVKGRIKPQDAAICNDA